MSAVAVAAVVAFTVVSGLRLSAVLLLAAVAEDDAGEGAAEKGRWPFFLSFSESAASRSSLIAVILALEALLLLGL